MDYEKLIEWLKKPCWGESAHLVDKERMEAAISALRPISRECGNKAAKKIVQEVLKND